MNYVDEYSLFPLLSRTSHYRFKKHMSLLLYNNPEDNGICQSRLHQLTIALHEKQFTTIGLTQTFNRFIAQKNKRFSINHYVLKIARYMEDTIIEETKTLTLN